VLCHVWCVVVMLCDGMCDAGWVGDTDVGEGRKICIRACICIAMVGEEDVVRDARLCLRIRMGDDVLKSGWWGGCGG
jgi:hypothetical protein